MCSAQTQILLQHLGTYLKAQAASAQSFTLWQQATVEII